MKGSQGVGRGLRREREEIESKGEEWRMKIGGFRHERRNGASLTLGEEEGDCSATG